MPELNWIGKNAVVRHHAEVPFRLLEEDRALSCGESETENLIVQGDNLEALKALLPRYAGQVKCIYIDPPYNTGNEGWVYNDATNSPEIRQWLGKTVGKEAEDLSRHDKWLCMMYPRLVLLREFLRKDGAIFISIDDNEVASLRLLMDEIFGSSNFVATVIWQKVYSPKNSARHFSEDHDYVIVYGKHAETWRPNLMARNEAQDAAYKNRDNDPRGVWKTSDLSARNPYSEGLYSVTSPSGRIISGPPMGRYWTISKSKFNELDADKRIWWGAKGTSIPQFKRFLTDVQQGVVPQTIWFYKDVGHTQEAKKELVSILSFPDSESVFITPKPTRLIERILQIATDKDSLILDSFAGSGTTGQAVLSLNKKDRGNRRFILAEIDKKIANEITAKRIRNVATGYTDAKGEKVTGLGGGFKFVKLGKTLFNESGAIREDVKFAELAEFVFFKETGRPLPRMKKASPLLGTHEGRAVYLLFNGILGDKSRDGGNVLTPAILAELPPHKGPRVIYAAACRIAAGRREREQIKFKQTPYELQVP